jgi:hypothetical protein
MSQQEPVSKVTVEKRRDGKYFFVLTFRGVTYPAQGPFSSMLQASASGQAVLKVAEAGTLSATAR